MYSIGDRVVKCDRNGDNGYSKQGDFGTVTELDTYTSTVSVMWDKGEGTSIFEKRVELINSPKAFVALSNAHDEYLADIRRIRKSLIEMGCIWDKKTNTFLMVKIGRASRRERVCQYV